MSINWVIALVIWAIGAPIASSFWKADGQEIPHENIIAGAVWPIVVGAYLITWLALHIILALEWLSAWRVTKKGAGR